MRLAFWAIHLYIVNRVKKTLCTSFEGSFKPERAELTRETGT